MKTFPSKFVRQFLVLSCLISLLHSCAPTANVVSNSLLQKRKYYKGWQVKLHRGGNDSNNQVESNQRESSNKKIRLENAMPSEESTIYIANAQNSTADSTLIDPMMDFPIGDSLKSKTPSEKKQSSVSSKFQKSLLNLPSHSNLTPSIQTNKPTEPKPVLTEELQKAKVLYFVFLALFMLSFLSFPFLNIAFTGVFSNVFSKLVFSVFIPLGVLIYSLVKMKKNEYYHTVIKPRNEKKKIASNATKEKIQLKKFEQSPELKKLKRENLSLHLALICSLLAIPFSLLFSEILAIALAGAFIILLFITLFHTNRILKMYNEVPIEQRDRMYKNQRSNLIFIQILKVILGACSILVGTLLILFALSW